MLFIENKKKKTRETKGKKACHSYHYFLGYYLNGRSVLLVKTVICRPDFPGFSMDIFTLM